ncbi:MAG TPA: isocitrate lyase/phosphoenolpyruvate mutase family protein [Bauldia sp.]|nr:isocitrate lyase/phosphoenolpyruvate mutase family protein [Bauldia sp.]
MPSVAAKRRLFREMHREGCFVLPNPWDIGSARWLQGAGFKALATTSAGAAWALGYPDGGLPLDAMLSHIRTIVEVTDLPVNADFLNGFAREPQRVAENVRRCIETGVAALSIEDSTGDRREPLYRFDLAVARIRAARAAIDAAGGEALLVARSECYLTGHPEPRKEALRRLTAFAEAGADCLYAPGAATREDIAAIVMAVAPKPVNVLARKLNGLTVNDLAGLGVRRISVGGAMARMAWAGLIRSAREILDEGRFDAFEQATPGSDLDGFFAADREARS